MLKRKAKQLLGEALTLRLMQAKHLLKLKFYEHKVGDIENEKFTILRELKSQPVLFAGYPKSGNTWLRFLIFNYFNILNNNPQSTLSYSELNNIYQQDVIGLPLNKQTPDTKFKGINFTAEGFPHLIRTHSHFKNEYTFFEKIIFISRNPLDALVSSFHFHIKNRSDGQKVTFPFDTINSYVLFKIPIWVHHFQSYYDRSEVIHITYEGLKRDPRTNLVRVLNFMDYEKIDERALNKSIEYSSFKSIKKMGREKNEQKGMTRKSSYKGEFTRKGKVGGFNDELQQSTVDKANKMLKKASIPFEIW